MKLSKVYTKAINVVILFGLISTSSVAGSLTLGYSNSGGHHDNQSNRGHHYSSRHYNYGHRNSYSPKYYAYPSYPVQPHHNYNNYRNHSLYTKPCRQVSKTVVDGYGGYKKIGGTLCYDRYGQGYIVSGSRYHLR